MTLALPAARWRRPPPDPAHRPVTAYPKPLPPDPGKPAPAAPRPAPGPAPALTVTWAAPPPPDAARPRSAPPHWRPESQTPARVPSRGSPPGPATAVIWSLPPPPVLRPAAASKDRFHITTPCPAPPPGDGVNYDPPPEAGGTGLQATNPDGSWVVHPLSVIHPGSQVGDEGPINEAFLSTPVVYLCAGRPYMLASPVVIPNGATLHLNRAAIDRSMIQPGEGAAVYD